MQPEEFGIDLQANRCEAVTVVAELAPGTWSLAEVGTRMEGDLETEWTIRTGANCGAFDGSEPLLLVPMSSPENDTLLLGFTPPLPAVLAYGADLVIEDPHGGLSASEFVIADVTGDGRDDLVLGNSSNALAGGDFGEGAGELWVFAGPVPPDISVDEATATISPDLDHEWGLFAFQVCAGDLDGDGVTDLAAGAPGNYSEYTLFSAGSLWVMLGPIEGDRTLDDNGELTAGDALWLGETYEDAAGYALSCALDVTGDGRADMVAGAPQEAEPGGIAYVVDGGITGKHSLSEATWRVEGGSEVSHLGVRLSAESDLDADGQGDLALGAWVEDDAGRVFVYYGGGLSGTATLAEADATLVGEAGDYAQVVAGGADLDGDGFDDLAVGANSVGDGAGAVYVFFGGMRP